MKLLRNKKNKNLDTYPIDKPLIKGGFWGPYRIRSDWLNLLCLIITLGVAVWSVDQAGWIRPSTSLVTILIIAAAVGFVLAKSSLPAASSHPLALILGLAVIFWQGILLFPDPSFISRVMHLANDIQVWWHAQTIGAPSPVTIHIALIFGYLTWIIGYFSTWSVIRKKNPWIAAFLGTVVILINLNFWVREKYYYFLIYAIAALILVVVVTYTKNSSYLKKENYSRTPWGPVLWAASSLCVIIIAVSISWNNPGYRIDKIADSAKSHDPFKGTLQTYWQSFFAPVPGSGVPTLNHGGQQELVFGGPLDLNDQVDFIINTDQKNYWKTQIYDLYTSSGWKTSAIQEEVIEKGALNSANSQSTSNNNEYKYTIINQVYTNVLPTVGNFLSGDIPLVEKVLTPQVFEIYLFDSSSDSLLPSDIASAAKTIRRYGFNRRRSMQEIANLLPAGLKLISTNSSGYTIQSISVSRDPPEDKDVVAIASSQIRTWQQRATITVEPPPDITAKQLATAEAIYPQQIKDRYLQLPSSLPARVKDLAFSITREFNTPYLKTQAIKDYLAKYSYSLNIDSPPAGSDGVDYFLFTQKSGYCNYFASAATVMLRSIGIPARMVVGFLPGQYDEGNHSYIIRDRDYHAWTEVYFPGYGWVQLDATPPRTSAAEASSGTSDQLNNPFIPYSPYYDSGGDTSILTSSASTNSGNYTGLVIFTIGYALCILFIVEIVRITNRKKNTSAIYSRMVLLSSLAGLGPKPWQTALEFSKQLSMALPRQASIIDNITQKYLTTRYGRGATLISTEDKFKNTWPALRWALTKRIMRIK